MSVKRIVKIAIITIICAGLILCYYCYLTHRDRNGAQNQDDKRTAIEKCLDRDLDYDYPKTPREVVKYFNEIQMCLYNEQPSDDQLKKLADQQFKLLDKELQDNNPALQYYENIRQDVKSYRAAECIIVSAVLCSSDEVTYKNDENKGECAFVTCSYLLRDRNGATPMNQMYVLRKDENGNWRILVYYITEKTKED